jgi:hypothetical protein
VAAEVRAANFTARSVETHGEISKEGEFEALEKREENL